MVHIRPTDMQVVQQLLKKCTRRLSNLTALEHTEELLLLDGKLARLARLSDEDAFCVWQ